jgi:hypothetical protein
VLGWPLAGGDDPVPPAGRWVSSKDGSGYDYELRWLS